MNISTVNELITSLESAGDLLIKERKYLELAKAYQQLAAENVGLKAAHPQPFGPEMMKALDAYEKQQDEVPETGMLDAFFILRDSIRLETPATDRIYAGIKADGVEDEPFGFVSRSGDLVVIELNGDRHIRDGMPVFVKELREGAK